jgi:hypothetical protein
MTDQVSLDRIAETAATLKEHGVVTLADLRMCVCRDFDNGTRWLALNTGISLSLLTALLIAEAKENPTRRSGRRLFREWRALKTFPAILFLSAARVGKLRREKTLWKIYGPVWWVLRQSAIRTRRLLYDWRRHWPDVLILIIVPAVLVGLVFRAYLIDRNAPTRVAANRSLPVFHKISEGVEVQKVSGFVDAFESLDQVRDRVTLTAVPAGSILKPTQLLSMDLSKKMRDRKILTIPLETDHYPSKLALPAEAILTFSARQGDLKTGPVSCEVIVLDIQDSVKAGWKSATVALRESDFKVAALVLGSHDAFLSPLVAE